MTNDPHPSSPFQGEESLKRRWIIVMGVSGSGKSTLGEALSRAFGLPFLEGDAFHPPANVEKMRAGTPLNDDDRWPWLDALGAALRDAEGGAILACSALRVVYRQRLRQAAQHKLDFLWVKVDRAKLEERMRGRVGHYMPPSLLASQLATLEPPAPGENIITLIGARSPKNLLNDALRHLSA